MRRTKLLVATALLALACGPGRSAHAPPHAPPPPTPAGAAPPAALPSAEAAAPDFERDAPAPIEETFLGCPPGGDRGGDEALNLLKNRIDDATRARTVTFAELLALPSPAGTSKRHRAKWSPEDRESIARHEGRPVTLRGFVFDAKREDVESPNCHDEDERQKDVHVWLVAQPGDDRSAAVVVEVTPRVRARHPAWTVPALRKLAHDRVAVRVTGWLMFDQEHGEQLAPHGTSRGATRGTLWEIHPITRIELETGGEL